MSYGIKRVSGKRFYMERVKDLEGELELREEMLKVKEQEIRLEEKDKRMEIRDEFIKCQAENKQLIKRMDEHPYKLVSDMLKALVVKFPTLNINDLAISTGKK